MKKGFTLIEILVGTAVFLIVAFSAYQAYISLFNLVNLNQYKIMGLNLANERFEIVRNLSYIDIGEISGVPNGIVPHVETFVRGGITFIATTTIRNIDLPFDGTIGGTPDDLSPADNKLVEVEVGCPSCKNFTPVILTTTVAPKNLETASTNGALFIKVFDANGQPVSDANVHIVNITVTPNINIDDITDANGMLRIIDAPPAIQSYAISVSKSGYSSARTYPPGDAGNPDPTQPDATVILQQVTQVSLSIDKISSVHFSSMNSSCIAIGGGDFSMSSSKMIGIDVPKYSANITTDGSGFYSNNSIEWDSYNIGSIDSTYEIAGINPVNPIYIQPDSSNEVKLIMKSRDPKSLLVTILDGSLFLPVADAEVTLTNTSGYSSMKTTGRGYISQTDWSTGSGYEDFNNDAVYYFDDGGVDVTSTSGEIKLKDSFGSYSSSGELESSTIDTGSASNFHNLLWTPTDQPIPTGVDSARFQLATNEEITATTTWDWKGPDGTSSTYYTASDQTINSIHNGDRYVRYKAFLSTEVSTSTPNISDVSFTYTSDCTPPGQVIFSGLSSGDYDISISKTGYTTEVDIVNISSDWISKNIEISP